MKYAQRIPALVLVLALLMTNSGATALADAVLILPAALRIIEEEAFSGNASIEKVVLPDDITEIRERAFAGSALTEINLPDSLTFIAEDAFDGPDKVTVAVNPGTYAYGWAVSNGYISSDQIPETPADEFTFDANTGTVTAFTGSRETVRIPAAIGGVAVTGIASNAFYGNTAIKTVVIPSSVTSLGSHAFGNCTNLKRVESPIAWPPDGTPGTRPFYGCSLKEFEITGNITTVPAYVFYRDEFRTLEKIVLPDTVTAIGNGAFSACSNLTSLTVGDDTGSLRFPDGLKSIGDSAFSQCSALTSVTFPYGLETIGASAFSSCAGLTCDLIIPSSVTSLGSHAFGNCTNLKRVESPIAWPPDGTPGTRPFSGCSLKEFEITGTITTVPAYVFYRDEFRTLEKIVLPDTVTAIGNGAFSACSNLTSLTVGDDTGSLRFPDGLKSIGDSAFSQCSALTSVTFPYGLETIGASAFSSCAGLTCDLIIPSSVTSLGNYAFGNCTGLERVESPIAWPPDGTPSTRPFSGCSLKEFEITGTITTVPAYVFNRNEFRTLEKIILPDTVTAIGNGAFSACSNLTSLTVGDDTGSLRFPDGLKSIGDSAFSQCSGLTSVTFPYGLETIGASAFSGCAGLTCDLIIPSSVTSLGDYAFGNCTGLERVESPIAWPPNGTPSTRPFSGCSLKEFEITGNITTVPAYVFYRDEFRTLEKIVLPDTVTAIGSSAFANCPALSRINIGGAVTAISENAFGGHSDSLVIYGEAGSFAQTYADGHEIAFSTQTMPVNRITVSGYVLDENGQGIRNVRVTLYLGSAQSGESVTVQTNGSGYWSWASAKPNRSYVITFRKDGCVFTIPSLTCATGSESVAVRTVYGGADSVPAAAVHGYVKNTADQPVQGIYVYVTNSEDSGADSFAVQTDKNGHWQVTGLIIGQQYHISYCTADYSITPASQDVTAAAGMSALTAAVSLEQSEAPAAAISFSMTDGVSAVSTVPTGKKVTFTVQAANATKARLVVDGYPYESFSIADGTAVFERAFSREGARSIAFQAGDENGWNVLSAARTLEVTANGGSLAEPVFVTAPGQQYAFGDEITISWHSVPNASAYALYLYCNGICVWHPETAGNELSHTFTADDIPAAGDYSLVVMATGYGFTQSEAGISFSVVGRAYALTLDTPQTNNQFVPGDRFYLSASNPGGAYVMFQVTDPDGVSILLPETGATNSPAPGCYYTPTKLGGYTVQAFGFENANLTSVAFATCASNTAQVSVNGAIISSVNVGTGYGNMFTTEAVSAYATANNAVERVEICEGETLLAEITQFQEENYIRTFSTELPAPTAGLHSYVFRGYDQDSGDMGTRTFTFYAVAPAEQRFVYAKSNGLELLKYPVGDSEKRDVSVFVSDPLTLLGTYGAYSYVKCGNTKGFAPTAMLSDTPVRTIDGLQLSLRSPADNGLDYIASDHSIPVSWAVNMASVPATMKFRVTMSPNANPLYPKRVTTADTVCQFPSGLLEEGEYTVFVELTNSDGSITYGRSNSAVIQVYGAYEDYLFELNYDPLAEWVDSFEYHLAFVRGSQTMFTTGTVMDDGTVAYFDLESMTNGKMKAMYAAAVGDYAVTADVIDAVKAMTIVQMLAEQYGSKSTWISYDDAKDLFDWLSIPNEFVDMIFGLRTVTGRDGKPIQNMVRTFKNGKPYIKFDADQFKQLKNSKELSDKYSMSKVAEYLEYAEAILGIIKNFTLYQSISSDTCRDIARHFYATGDKMLNYAAQYMEMMSDTDGALALAALIQGVDLGKSTINKAVIEGGWAIAQKLAAGSPFCAFVAGAKFGAVVGRTINKTFLNVDGIYSAAFTTQYYVDGAEAFYPYVKRVKDAFKADPEANYEKMYAAASLYGRMVAGCYAGCSTIYDAFDKAWVNKFWNYVSSSSGNQGTIDTCNSLSRTLKTYFNNDYIGFLRARLEKQNSGK